MFTLGISGILAAYILLAVLLLSINLYSGWSWRVKTAAIIIVSVFLYRNVHIVSTLTGLANQSKST